MNNSSFLKDAGAFLITFLLGSISLHGMLYFLITDAGDIWINDSLFPLIALLVLYGTLPLIILTVWRNYFSHNRLFEYAEKQSKFYKQALLAEKIAQSLLWIGAILYSVYVVALLTDNLDLESLHAASIVLTAAGITVLLYHAIALFKSKKNQKDDKADTANDKLAASLFREFKIEFVLIFAGWLLTLSYILWAVNSISSGVVFGVDKVAYESAPPQEKPDLNDVEQRMRAAKAKIEHANTMLGLNQELHRALLLSRTITDSTTTNYQEQKSQIDVYLAKLDTSNELELSTIAAFKPLLELSKAGINSSAQIDLYNWVNNTDNKLYLIKQSAQDNLAQLLFLILLKGQAYYLILFVILLFYSLMYWLIANYSYNVSLTLDNTDKTPEALPEIEFSKSLLVLVFVFMVPILKPIKLESIQFNKPLWTAGVATVQKVTQPVEIPLGQNAPITINYIHQKNGENTENQLVVKNLNQIDSLLNLQKGKDYDKVLEEIRQKVTKIEAEVKNTKRR